jgi:hypothetical protein
MLTPAMAELRLGRRAFLRRAWLPLALELELVLFQVFARFHLVFLSGLLELEEYLEILGLVPSLIA